MPVADLVAQADRAFTLALSLGLPVLAVAAVVSLLVATVQSVLQIHDAALLHLPRLLAVAFTLAALGPWMGRQVAAFAAHVWSGQG